MAYGWRNLKIAKKGFHRQPPPNKDILRVFKNKTLNLYTGYK